MQNLVSKSPDIPADNTEVVEVAEDLAVEILDREADEDLAIKEIEDFRQRLFTQAFGYEVEDMEIIEEASGAIKQIVRRRHRIPGDQKALEKYLSIFGRP